MHLKARFRTQDSKTILERIDSGGRVHSERIETQKLKREQNEKRQRLNKLCKYMTGRRINLTFTIAEEDDEDATSPSGSECILSSFVPPSKEKVSDILSGMFRSDEKLRTHYQAGMR